MINNITLQESMEIIDELLTEAMNGPININEEIICEKVEWKRNINSILREFNYNPNNKTIKYKGNTYNLILSRSHDSSTNRKDTIYLDMNDARSNTPEQIRGTILHEIGHIVTNDNKKSNTFSSQYKDIEDSKIKAKSIKLNNNPIIDKTLKSVFTAGLDINNLRLMPDEARLFKKYKSNKKLSEEELAKLDKAMHSKRISEIIKKYRVGNPGQDDHTLQAETQADLYEAKHSSFKDTLDNLNNMYNNLNNFEKYSKEYKSKLHDSFADITSDNPYDKYKGYEKELQKMKNSLNNIQDKSDTKTYSEIKNKISDCENKLQSLKKSFSGDIIRSRIATKKVVDNNNDSIKRDYEAQKRDRDYRVEALKSAKYAKANINGETFRAGDKFTKAGEDDGKFDYTNKQIGANGITRKQNPMAIIKSDKNNSK